MAGAPAAVFPGLVVRVAVEAGQEVAEGEPLIILEAMKMENAIPAPQAGRIKEIIVKKDDTVATQQVLMVME